MAINYDTLKASLSNPRAITFTPEKQLYLLNPHDYPERQVGRLLERTDDGWIFRGLSGEDLEYRTHLLDNGQSRTQESWHNDYRETCEGQEGWRLPTTEEVVEMFYSLLMLSKDPRYAQDVRLVLDGDEQNNVPGLRQNINWWLILADHIQYEDNLKARITNPYGKDETKKKDITVEIPDYSNRLVLAPEQHEGLLGSQRTPDDASWLESLVGSKWLLLPQILQFIAARTGQEQHLREARIWTPSKKSRNNYSGRVVSLGFDHWFDLGFDDGEDYVESAFGVRSAKNSP